MWIAIGSRRRFLLLAIIAAAVMFGQTPVRLGAQSDIDTIGDIVVVPNADADQVFVTDPARRGVFVFDWSDRANSIVRLDNFRAAFSNSRLRQPTALAVYEGSLYVIDVAIPALVAIDLASREERLIYAGPPLKRPTGLAVSQFGIAIADPAAAAVIAISGDDKRVVTVDYSFQEPTRVQFDSDNLLVLDRRGLWRGRVQGKWATVFSGRNAFVQDVAAYRGIYYVADDERLTTFAAERAPTRIPTPGIERSRFARIAMRAGTLVAADFQQRVVTRMNRPVPVTFRWNPVRNVRSSADARSVATNALTASYDYLARNGRLQFVPVRTAAPQRMDEWLVNQRVLIWPLVAGERAPTVNQDAFSPLEDLLCQRNNELCSSQRGELLSRPLTGNELVWLPEVRLSTSIATGEVELNGRRVEEHLRERVASAEQRIQITDANLAELNRNDRESLEIEFTRRGFILATPASPAVRPGALIRIEDGRDVVLGSVQTNCGIEFKTRSDRMSFPQLVKTSNPNDYLPQRPGIYRNPAIRAQSGEVEFSALTLDRIEAADYEKLRSLGPHPCLHARGPAAYLVTQTLSTSDARYRLLRDGKLVALSLEDLRGWNLLGVPFQEPVWSMAVLGPVGVAYRAIPLDAARMAWDETTPLPVSRVKPQSPQNLFNRSLGSFVLPLSTWQFDALIDSQDVEAGSKLRQLEAEHAGLSIASPYVQPPRAAADVQSCGAEGLVTEQAVQGRLSTARLALLKAIQYDEALGRDLIERIGVSERTTTVDMDHPAFARADGETVWLQPDTVLGLRPRTARPAPEGTAKLRPFDLNQDHGTHVAGILASQSGIMPGLLPDSTLFLVNPETEDTLIRDITTAINAGIQFFSFSWDWPFNPQSLSSFKKALKERWTDQLFVVSAGNSGKDLSEIGAIPLVSWVIEHDNILGVGSATTDAKDVLGEWDENGAPKDGSSFGIRYVHLLAPGRSVAGLAKDNSYTCATGSSTATPQVAAAAAILRSIGIASAVQIKARLIYTADWQTAFEGKVLGGTLNVTRAAFAHNLNVYKTHSGKQPISIALKDESVISITNGVMYESGQKVAAPPQVTASKILRLQWLRGSTYRALILKDDGFLRAITGDLSGTLKCHTLKEWKEEAGVGRWDDTPALRNKCRSGVPVTELESYVARVPGVVKF
jgi:subtilisin family serine protease